MLGEFPKWSEIHVHRVLLHQLLLYFKKESNVKDWFTRMVSERRGEPKLMVNIEIIKNRDLCKRRARICVTLEVKWLNDFL